MSDFRVSAAKEILRRIRLGETIGQICAGDEELRLEIYDWIRDPKCKVGKVTFESLYQKAVQDRAMTWEDNVLADTDMLTLMGNREDTGRLRQLEQRTNLLLRLAKEAKASRPASTETVEVVLRTFGKRAKGD